MSKMQMATNILLIQKQGRINLHHVLRPWILKVVVQCLAREESHLMVCQTPYIV
jgi:hypothetical protein